MFSFIAETKMIATRPVVGPESGEAGHVFSNFINSCIGHYSALNSKSPTRLHSGAVSVIKAFPLSVIIKTTIK